MADEDLVERARTDPDAFAELYRRYVNRVHAFVYRRSRSTEIADEITSATFERALRALPGFRWREGGFQAWIYRIAANELASHYRRAQRQHSERGQRAARQLHEASTTVEHPLDNDDGDLVLQALGRLNERYQRAITLRYLTGLSPEDAAHAMGLNKATLAVVLHRALGALRKAMHELERTRRGPWRPARGQRADEAGRAPRRAGAPGLPAGPAPRSAPGRRPRGPPLPGVRRDAGVVRARRCSAARRRRRLVMVAGLGAAAAATVAAVVLHRGSTPGFELQAASGAVALFPDGASRPVHAGDQFPPGGLIQTGPSGAVTIEGTKIGPDQVVLLSDEGLTLLPSHSTSDQAAADVPPADPPAPHASTAAPEVTAPPEASVATSPAPVADPAPSSPVVPPADPVVATTPPETSAAPAPAVFTQPIGQLALTVGEDTGGVSLAWTPSDAADFGRYVIARGTAADHQLEDIAELGDRQITSFTDPAAPHGVVLMYRVVAMSEDGRPLAASDVVELTLQDGSASSAPTTDAPPTTDGTGSGLTVPPTTDGRVRRRCRARPLRPRRHPPRASRPPRPGRRRRPAPPSAPTTHGDDLRPAARARDDERPDADDERPVDAARHRAGVQRAADGHHADPAADRHAPPLAAGPVGRTVAERQGATQSSSGLSSTSCSTTWPSTASMRTKPRRRGGSSVE